jgi:hypothetical protein
MGESHIDVVCGVAEPQAQLGAIAVELWRDSHWVGQELESFPQPSDLG